jgi:hypothetical protein
MRSPPGKKSGNWPGAGRPYRNASAACRWPPRRPAFGGPRQSALMMRCRDGTPFSGFRARNGLASGLRRGLKFQSFERNFHGQIAHAVEFPHRGLGQVIEREIVIAHFVGSQVPEIRLRIDVGAIGDFFAYRRNRGPLFPAGRRPSPNGRLRTGDGEFTAGKKHDGNRRGNGIVVVREPVGRINFTAFAPRSHTATRPSRSTSNDSPYTSAAPLALPADSLGT